MELRYSNAAWRRFANTPTLTFSEREHTMSLDHTDEKNAQPKIKLAR